MNKGVKSEWCLVLFIITLLSFYLLSFSFYIGATFLWKRLICILNSSGYRCISLWIKPVAGVVMLGMVGDKNRG